MFFKALLADRLTFRRASGMVVDKGTFLKDLMNPANTYDTLESEDISVQVHEDVALVTLCVPAKGMRDGKPFGGVFRADVITKRKKYTLKISEKATR